MRRGSAQNSKKRINKKTNQIIEDQHTNNQEQMKPGIVLCGNMCRISLEK